MNSNNENIIRLIQVYLSGELTDDEWNELREWCEKTPENQDFLNRMAGEDVFSREFTTYQAIDEEKAFRQFEGTVIRKRYGLRVWMKYAAVLILPLLMVTLWQWKDRQPAETTVKVIVPGSAKAVLTLAGGQQVNLTGHCQSDIQISDEVEVKQKGGMLAYYSRPGIDSRGPGYNTLSTGRGGEYRLVLADGTKVFLNAASTLKYPVAFRGNERKVQLEGEAYFEVAKDSACAFVVEAKGVNVKVYGTSFNINTSKSNEIETVLVEGSIGVRTAGGRKEYRIEPGQMAVWNRKSGSLELKEVEVSFYTAWKDGLFRFNRERLEDILITLANWYDVEIFYQNQTVKDLHFSGSMERYDQIGVILEAMTEATGVQFAVQEKTIVVSK